MRWFFGPLLIVIGILLMKYCVAIGNYTGQIDFAQKYFGGTYHFIRFVGLAVSIFGLAWLTGIVKYNPNSEFQIQQGIHIIDSLFA